MLRRLPPNHQESPIMQGADVRDANQEMAADLQRSKDLVEYPEDFFSVFQNLICDDQIGLSIRKRQGIALNICHTYFVGFSCQALRVFCSTFHGNEFGIRMKLPYHSEISARTRSQISHDIKAAQVSDNVLYHEGTIRFLLVSESTKRM